MSISVLIKERRKKIKRLTGIFNNLVASRMTAQRRKVVLVGPAFPYRGGNALFMTSVYQLLAPHYETVFLNFSVLYPSLLFPGKTQFDRSQQAIPKIPNQRVIHSYNPLNWIKVARLIHRENPDLILMDWWHPYFGPCYFGITAALPSSLRRKIVIITENVISHEANPLDTVLTRLGLRHAAAFITLSAAVQQSLRFLAKQRPIYQIAPPVPHFYTRLGELPPTSVARQQLGLPEDGDVVLFFGYVRRYKGLDVLLRAFAQVQRQRPGTYLLIGGEFYDDEKFYQDLIRQLGLQDTVRIYNEYIPNEQVGVFYRAADVVVLPYREATQSGILMTAYAFDKPAIVTNVGGLAELVEEGKTGFIVPPEDPDALAAAISNFFEREKERNFVPDIRRKVAENAFSQLPKVVEELLERLSC